MQSIQEMSCNSRTQDEMLDLIVFNTRFISGKGIFKSFTGMVKGDYMILIFNACFLYIKL